MRQQRKIIDYAQGIAQVAFVSGASRVEAVRSVFRNARTRSQEASYIDDIRDMHREERLVLVLGDGNLGMTYRRAAHAANIVKLSYGDVAILLGTEREKKVMREAFTSMRLVEGRNFTLADDSRNTRQNAKTAAAIVDSYVVKTLLVLTHQYHETPVPGINRVTDIFSAQFPDHVIKLELIPGVHIRQRAVQTLSGLADRVRIAAENGESERTTRAVHTFFENIAIRREQVRIFFDRKIM